MARSEVAKPGAHRQAEFEPLGARNIGIARLLEKGWQAAIRMAARLAKAGVRNR